MRPKCSSGLIIATADVRFLSEVLTDSEQQKADIAAVGAYITSIPLGIAATIAVIFHEIPQEIADFGVLLYAGLSKTKALLFNFLSAATAIIGTLIGLILAGHFHDFSHFIIPFAAGNFIYIAAANLVPELHHECKFRETFIHLIVILIGISIMALIAIYGPEHLH